MSVIKQVTAVKGVPASYRIRNVDGQPVKPYPLWQYTWILPEGVDAEFKSISTGFPTVIVQWNETSSPGSPFKLKCEVRTDAEDCFGLNCISIETINISVGESIVNLNTDIWGATGACIKVGDNTVDTDVTYHAKSTSSKNIIWNVVNGKIRVQPGNTLIYGPYSSTTDSQGNSSISVNWLDGSTHNISAYGVDVSGNTSPIEILTTYPSPSIFADIDGLTTKEVNSGEAIFNFMVNNMRSFNPDYNIIYNLYIGHHNTTGPINNDLSYDWTTEILTVDNLRIGDISGSSNIYVRQYTLPNSLSPDRYRFKFKPQVVSNTDVTCRVEKTVSLDFKWEALSYVPEFIDHPDGDRSVTYIPIFRSEPSKVHDITYTPTFLYQPSSLHSTGGTQYSPIFITGPIKTINVEYSPTFIYSPSSTVYVEYSPLFITGPIKTINRSYVPIFINEPVGYEQPSYSPTFIYAPTSVISSEFTPIFITGPTDIKTVDFTPIFVTGPFGYEQSSYSPTFIYAPTSVISSEFTPIFITGPIDIRTVEFTPIFNGSNPIGYEQKPYTPTFIIYPELEIYTEFVPRFNSTPIKTVQVEFSPVFINTPGGIIS